MALGGAQHGVAHVADRQQDRLRHAFRDAERARTPVPLGRQGTGWEVACAALFLLSGESSYVTGQSLIVDGGLSGLT